MDRYSIFEEDRVNVKELLKLDDRMAAAQGLHRFTTLDLAMGFVNRAVKPHFVLLGDDDRYWVAVGRLARDLEKAGYEIVT